MDQVLRYRAELDTASLQAQLGAVQAQLAGNLTQMVQPVGQAINYSYQMGAQSILAAQDLTYRAQQQSFGGSLGRPFPGSYQEAFGGPRPPGMGDLAMGASGMNRYLSFAYTPREISTLSQRELGDRINDASAAASRGVLQTAGGAYGGWMGSGAGGMAGGAIGATLGGLAGFPGIGAAIGAGYGLFKGQQFGAEVGQNLYGPVGGAGLGTLAAGALGIGATPLAAIGAGIGSAAQLGLESYGRTAEVRDFLRQNAGIVPTGLSQNAAGIGFTRGQEEEIGYGLQRMAAKDQRFDSMRQGYDAYKQVMEAAAPLDLYQGQATSQQFLQRTQELVNAVKTIQTALHKSWEESIAAMQSMGQLGLTRSGQFQGLALQTRAVAMVTGQAPDQVLASALAGGAMAQGTNMFPLSGAGIGLGAVSQLGQLRQMGIRGVGGVDITAQLVAGAGGQAAVEDAFKSADIQYAQSESYQQFMAAAFNPATGQVDRGFVGRAMRGQVGLNEILDRANRNVFNNPQMGLIEANQAFEEAQPQIQAAIGPSGPAALRRAQIMSQVKLLGLPLSKDAFAAAGEDFAEEWGMSRPMARLESERLFNLPQLLRRQRQAEARQGEELERGALERESGISGALRRGFAWAREQGVDIGEAITKYPRRFGEAAGDFYESKILGITPRSNVRLSSEEMSEYLSRPDAMLRGGPTALETTGIAGLRTGYQPRQRLAEQLSPGTLPESGEFITPIGKGRVYGSNEEFLRAAQEAEASGQRMYQLPGRNIVGVREDPTMASADERRSAGYVAAAQNAPDTAEFRQAREELLTAIQRAGGDAVVKERLGHSYVNPAGQTVVASSPATKADQLASVLGLNKDFTKSDASGQAAYQVASRLMTAEERTKLEAGTLGPEVNRAQADAKLYQATRDFKSHLDNHGIATKDFDANIQDYAKMVDVLKDTKLSESDEKILEKLGYYDASGNLKENVKPEDLKAAQDRLAHFRVAAKGRPDGTFGLKGSPIEKSAEDVKAARGDVGYDEWVKDTMAGMDKMDIDNKKLKTYESIESISKARGGLHHAIGLLGIGDESERMKEAERIADMRGLTGDERTKFVQGWSSENMDAFATGGMGNEAAMRAGKLGLALEGVQSEDLAGMDTHQREDVIKEALVKAGGEGYTKEEYHELTETFLKRTKDGKEKISRSDAVGMAMDTQDVGDRTAATDNSKVAESIQAIPQQLSKLTSSVDGLAAALKG